MTTPDRTAILEAEFIRPPQPGLRLLSATLISLGRSLGISCFLPIAERTAITAEVASMERVALTWLLDRRNPEDMVYDVMQLGGREWLFAQLPAYMHTLSPVVMALAQKEMQLTERAIEAAMYDIEPKPAARGASPPPVPPPNS